MNQVEHRGHGVLQMGGHRPWPQGALLELPVLTEPRCHCVRVSSIGVRPVQPADGIGEDLRSRGDSGRRQRGRQQAA